MLNACPVMSSEMSANGRLSGNASSTVTGWMNDSNCAASTMYMKMNESRKAMMKPRPVRCSSLLEPATPAT